LTIQYDVDLSGVLADIYSPASAERHTAVVIASGYPDAGFEKHTGSKFKDTQSTRSWAERIAASGMTAIAYSNREPAADFLSVLRAAGEMADRVAVWACSGNVPVALSALTRNAPVRVRCAALLYGYMLDVDEAAAMFRFANPCAGMSIDDLDAGTPMFIVRCGRDETPRLNESIDAFVSRALTRNVPITLVNHAGAPHAFDLTDNSKRSREIIAESLRFLIRENV
jgi:dienelactone hydrolase